MMKKMKPLMLAIILLSCFSPSRQLIAQEEEKEPTTFNFGIAIVPQYAFASTMRFDFDFTLKNNNVITVAPMFSFARHSSLLFSSQNDSYDYYNHKNYPQDIALTGGGLKLTLRHFFGDFKQNSGLYLGGGLHYRYSHVTYKMEGWQNSTIDGDDYMTYGYADEEEDFNQVGVDFLLGYQMYLRDNIYGDFFAGWGFRMSDSNDENDNYWSETVFDIGYSGYTPLAGIRLGIFF